jgi:hypothetical protein
MSERRWLAPAIAAAAAVALLATYLALGGASYEPRAVADPCDPRPLPQVDGREAALEQLALSALDGAACELRVTREELALAISTEESQQRFLREHEVSDAELERAVRAGLERAIADGRRAGTLSGIEAALLEETVRRAPLSLLLRVLQTRAGRDIAELLLEGLSGGGGLGLDDLQGLLP